MQDPLIEVVGTIMTVEPFVYDTASHLYIHRLILENCMVVNNVINVPSRILIMIRSTDAISFKVNDPITVKGFFKRQKEDSLSYMYSVHAPQGYIRYSGRVFR